MRTIAHAVADALDCAWMGPVFARARYAVLAKRLVDERGRLSRLLGLGGSVRGDAEFKAVVAMTLDSVADQRVMVYALDVLVFRIPGERSDPALHRLLGWRAPA